VGKRSREKRKRTKGTEILSGRGALWVMREPFSASYYRNPLPPQSAPADLCTVMFFF